MSEEQREFVIYLNRQGMTVLAIRKYLKKIGILLTKEQIREAI